MSHHRVPARGFVCVHGHFYQPPRENPWTGEVDEERGAHPFHDWNERITAECYQPNTGAKILEMNGVKNVVVNNFARMSFDVGPTLMKWLERRAPAVHAAIAEGDRESRRTYSGHGSALALPYNHTILPLERPRDRRTQILWGVRDFEHRFGRRPEGIWLPEAAVNLATLEDVAAAGLTFTVLSAGQAVRTRAPGDEGWQDVRGGSVDPGRAYRQLLPSGREIALFFGHGDIARGVAFEGLLADGEEFAARLEGVLNGGARPDRIVNIITDGESYGHHHRFGEMALAYALGRLESTPGVRLTNYAEFLQRFPAVSEVQIAENTSWSCAHGIERWRSDCGCCTGARPEWNQAWRGPLREALEWLRDELQGWYERCAGAWLEDPWAARDDYVDVLLDGSRDNVDRFLSRHARHPLTAAERAATLAALEVQRNAMLMFTSCGWFFDDVGGVESLQLLRVAGRAMQLAGSGFGMSLETGLLKRLERARSNDPEVGDAARIYERSVRPFMLAPDLDRPRAVPG